MHLRQPGFTYCACEPYTKKNKETLQRFIKTGDSRYIYHNKLDKCLFQHNMAYGDFKGLTRRTASDKILLKLRNTMDIEGVLLQSCKIFLIKILLYA